MAATNPMRFEMVVLSLILGVYSGSRQGKLACYRQLTLIPR